MTQKNPWKTIGTRPVYSNPWISVREDTVIRPDGKEGIYGVVDTRVATGVVALTDDGQIYLVGQYRYPIDLYSWEIIEGGADRGEEPLIAAKRELREEAGLIADEWTQLGPHFHLSNCFSSEEAVVYMARGLREVEKEPEGTEVLEVRKIPFADCVKMVHAGEVTDSITLIGVLRAERFLAERA